MGCRGARAEGGSGEAGGKDHETGLAQSTSVKKAQA